MSETNVSKYSSKTGVTASVKDNELKLQGNFTCEACGAVVEYNLHGVNYVNSMRPDENSLSMDRFEYKNFDEFRVTCPVPYCGTERGVSLPPWAKMVVKSGYLKKTRGNE